MTKCPMHSQKSLRSDSPKNKWTRSAVFLAVSLMGIQGCSLTGKSEPEPTKPLKKKTIGSIAFNQVAIEKSELEAPSLRSLRNDYAALQESAGDPQTRESLSYRLADLEVLLGEQQQELGTDIGSDSYYSQAIQAYQQVLSDYPDKEGNDHVLYQLAKAYELQGEPEKSFEVLERLIQRYPNFQHVNEAYFRQGEFHYNRKEYTKAAAAYSQVLTLEEQLNQPLLESGELLVDDQQQTETYTAYAPISAYMLGWSLFKLDSLPASLVAFSRLLDLHFTTSQSVNAEARLEELTQGQLRLNKDAVRIMGLLFSYLDGADAIARHFDEIGPRGYESLIYQELGQLQLNNDRYRDSAAVYLAFAERHPTHHKAPEYYVRHIDAYILGDFPSLVLPAKQGFIEAYGITGEYWNAFSDSKKELITPYLDDYLQELAQYEHSRAQLIAKALLEQEDDAEEDSRQKQQEQKQIAYQNAARWYREYIETFPMSENMAVMTFNLAESLFEAGQMQEAIGAYEAYAYELNRELIEPEKASEAGYAAILAYRQLLESSSQEVDQQYWREKQMQSQMAFVDNFADNEHTQSVSHLLTQELFNAKRYEEAIVRAKQLLSFGPEQDIQISSHLVVAHSAFALQQFASAESEYRLLRELITPEDNRYVAMTDRLAASIYQQAQVAVEAGDKLTAVNELLRVIAATPNSDIRLTSQYDAATYLLELEEWQQATDLLEDFRKRFPSHELSDGIEDKLILAYQANEQWLLAATELEKVWIKSPNTDDGRQALYVAADYFYKAGETEKSRLSYRKYAHEYPQPFNEATEARFKMSEFYLASGEDAKRRYWLKKLMSADKEAGENRTDRSRYLAAMSSLVFATDQRVNFSKIKLGLPLKNSLAKKRKALDKTLKAYDLTMSYRVSEFTTAANFGIGEIYRQLANDLMNSDRPAKLSALELEQYDILLEEQAYPFEEKAIEIHQQNALRSQSGTYDRWVKDSFASLSQLVPGRYNKQETVEEASYEIY
ncbi:tetratricopeptide repeat protein [Alteromonadaceae bacterium M269]|nr:tetratricopeptide repeat protein [Alteromonadaceae bacterium M269]